MQNIQESRLTVQKEERNNICGCQKGNWEESEAPQWGPGALQGSRPKNEERQHERKEVQQGQGKEREGERGEKDGKK